MAPRITYVPVESMDDWMQDEMDRWAREGPMAGPDAATDHQVTAMYLLSV
ncbi:MAG: hypothetical protein WCB04_10100 [Mycobacteriales bacterium]